MTNATRLQNVSKSYGDTSALVNVTFSVDSGEMFALLGNNGAGKTTIIDIVTGQLESDSGEVETLGLNPVTDPIKVRKKIGVLPEREKPPRNITPREYFDFIADIRDIDDSTIKRRVMEWSNKLDFSSKLDTLCSDMSRGEEQMTMIIQAFIGSPEMIIIDEPLVNLDPQRQERVKEALLKYRNRGNTVILSTHRLSLAEDIATEVGIIHNGRIKDVVRSKDIDDGTTLEEYFEENTLPIPSINK